MTLTFGPKLGPNRTYGLTHGYVQTSQGLVAIPIHGGEPVPHKRMFQHASTMYVDRVNKLLWVLFNRSVGGSVYNMSEWTDADLANPDFNPPPVFHIPAVNYSDFVDRVVEFYDADGLPATSILRNNPMTGMSIEFNVWVGGGVAYHGKIYTQNPGYQFTHHRVARHGSLYRMYYVSSPVSIALPYSGLGMVDYEVPYLWRPSVNEHAIAVPASKLAFIETLGNNSMMVIGLYNRGIALMAMNDTEFTDFAGEFSTTLLQNDPRTGVLAYTCIRPRDIDDSPFVFPNVYTSEGPPPHLHLLTSSSAI